MLLIAVDTFRPIYDLSQDDSQFL